jgi:hypothetical protein
MLHAPGTRHFEIDSRILASLEARKGRFERNARIISKPGYKGRAEEGDRSCKTDAKKINCTE